MGLVDELRINLQAEMLGCGLPLIGAAARLQLQDVRRFGNGTLALTYTP